MPVHEASSKNEKEGHTVGQKSNGEDFSIEQIEVTFHILHVNCIERNKDRRERMPG